MPKNYRKRERERERILQEIAGQTAPRPAAPPPAKKWWRKRLRVTDSLIGLGSAAILAVYSVGYLHTQHSVGDAFSEAIPTQPAATPVPGQGPLVTIATPSPTPGPSGYRDGTFVGVGSSRHGDIEATVVIENGKITSASVTDCRTRYSCRYMDPLVGEVISTQTAPVDHVSGASDSSKAYTDAVKAALIQAS